MGEFLRAFATGTALALGGVLLAFVVFVLVKSIVKRALDRLRELKWWWGS